MRISVVVSMFVAFIVTTALPAPASATTISQAIRLCQKNPSCTVTKTKDGAVLCVGGSNGGCAHEIACLNKRGCIVASAKGRNPGRVGPILTGTAQQPPKESPRNNTGVKAPNEKTAQDGTLKVVRDHRSTPVVRDHRTDPVVRDHREQSTRTEGPSHR